MHDSRTQPSNGEGGFGAASGGSRFLDLPFYKRPLLVCPPWVGNSIQETGEGSSSYRVIRHGAVYVRVLTVVVVMVPSDCLNTVTGPRFFDGPSTIQDSVRTEDHNKPFRKLRTVRNVNN